MQDLVSKSSSPFAVFLYFVRFRVLLESFFWGFPLCSGPHGFHFDGLFFEGWGGGGSACLHRQWQTQRNIPLRKQAKPQTLDKTPPNETHFPFHFSQVWLTLEPCFCFFKFKKNGQCGPPGSSQGLVVDHFSRHCSVTYWKIEVAKNT